MTRALVALVLVACTPQGAQRGRDRAPDGPADPAAWSVSGPRADATTTATGTGTGATTTSTVDPNLVLGGVVACADPTLRDETFYDTEWHTLGNPATRRVAGGGFVLADLDGDGLLDLVVGGEPPETFRGADSGRSFASDPLGLDGMDLDQMVGGSAADYDGDGDLDLYITRWARGDLLLRNDGGVFADVTEDAGISRIAADSDTASWDDFDGDGWLDLYVGAYGDPAVLYRNNGDGTFADVKDLLPPELDSTWVFMSAWYDLDGDNDRELFVVNDFHQIVDPRMLRNDGGVFVLDDSAGFHPNFDGMGLGVGDTNSDGLPDFLETSNRVLALLESTPSAQSDTGVLYINGAAAKGVELQIIPPKAQAWGWGAELADLDNDGDQDGIATFGAWEGLVGADDEYDEVFEWDGQTFLEVGGDPSWNLAWAPSTRGLAVYDLDGDGTVDVLRRALDAELRIDRGRCSDRAWLEVELVDERTPNLRGIGASLQVMADGVTYTEWIVSGGTSMFVGGPPVAHFGLGDATWIDELCAIWPDGDRQCITGIEPRQKVTLVRPALP